jgi:hypothetical protein
VRACIRHQSMCTQQRTRNNARTRTSTQESGRRRTELLLEARDVDGIGEVVVAAGEEGDGQLGRHMREQVRRRRALAVALHVARLAPVVPLEGVRVRSLRPVVDTAHKGPHRSVTHTHTTHDTRTRHTCRGHWYQWIMLSTEVGLGS